MRPVKNIAVIVLLGSALIVLALLLNKVISRARVIETAPDETAVNDPELGFPSEEALTDTPTIQPTITALLPTETLTPTSTRISSAYYQPPSDGCDVAGFVADVTIPDGTEMAPGTSFTKTWRLSNDGSCTWTSDYTIYFYSGSLLGGQTSQQLVENDAAPGSSIEVSLELVAPEEQGTYIGYWALENADGKHFGIGVYEEAFYVEIVVSDAVATSTGTAEPGGTPTPTETASATAVSATETETWTETILPSPTDTTTSAATETLTPEP